MLLDGEDGTNYDRAELGFFKQVLGGAKKGITSAAKVATMPITKVTLPVGKAVVTKGVAMASKVPTPILAAATGGMSLMPMFLAKKAGLTPAAPTNLVQEVQLPACGFWSRLKRAFGSNVTDCQ